MSFVKTFKYPKKIHVRGTTYKVVFVKKLDCLGETNWETRTIKIKAGMGKNETFKTFLHELCHAVEFSWPIKLKHKTVYELEEAIFQLLLENFL